MLNIQNVLLVVSRMSLPSALAFALLQGLIATQKEV
jgi:hypothetical protein